MDYDDSIKGKSDSALEVDRFHFNRIISRESSVGQSSRIYYRNPEGVPFKWEMQPGTPKNRPREEVIPPPSPPPAVQSLWLPKSSCADQLRKDSKHSISKLWFWKKHKKKQQVHLKAQRPADHAGEMMSDKYENFEFGDSDGEFMESVQDSNYSASLSSLTGHSSLHQSRFGREYDNVVDKPFGCSPWNMTELRMEEDSSTCSNQGQRSRSAPANQSDGALFKRIFTRSSPANKSCRLYYRISEAEGVPFKWEKMPGMSNNPTKEEIIPPPTPPPALQNLGLHIPQPHQFSNWTRLRFVVKHKLMWNRK